MDGDPIKWPNTYHIYHFLAMSVTEALIKKTYFLLHCIILSANKKFFNLITNHYGSWEKMYVLVLTLDTDVCLLMLNKFIPSIN